MAVRSDDAPAMQRYRQGAATGNTMERCKSIVIQLLVEKRQCQKVRSCKQFSWSRQGDAAASAAAAAAAASCSCCCRSTGRRARSARDHSLPPLPQNIVTNDHICVSHKSCNSVCISHTRPPPFGLTESHRRGAAVSSKPIRESTVSHSPLQKPFPIKLKQNRVQFDAADVSVTVSCW